MLPPYSMDSERSKPLLREGDLWTAGDQETNQSFMKHFHRNGWDSIKSRGSSERRFSFSPSWYEAGSAIVAESFHSFSHFAAVNAAFIFWQLTRKRWHILSCSEKCKCRGQRFVERLSAADQVLHSKLSAHSQAMIYFWQNVDSFSFLILRLFHFFCFLGKYIQCVGLSVHVYIYNSSFYNMYLCFFNSILVRATMSLKNNNNKIRI